ncbi:MAG: hypothetical protein A2Y62_20820 [Candidatus Fischerbacteria bacterium RBG_13_37_8]|uniref:Methyltransferase type 11 domain-containing protein n=1 Tax=Candidatus Fischerbacteria bacterium RBG_13_37_8 TaxID=1817863 RepID=A0A1F5VEU0_9BACT|nr:MAG: hypothetical protein A2Y62_20820 [Candidatus Fischerbacteria bacterium RBG_13_37_8]
MQKIASAHENKKYLQQFSTIFPDPADAEKYITASFKRIQYVLELLQFLHAQNVHKVLELGANPYYMTLLIKKYFDFEMQLANFFGNSADNGIHTQKVTGADEAHDFHFAHFNVEVDQFPYENDFFDSILFCEILEHLILNPDFAFSEIHRVLKPGGYLILTTPNVTRIYNVVFLLKNINIYDDYSPNGIYGRHNREYTLQEVIDLLNSHHFSIIKTMVKNIGPHPWKSSIVRALRPKLWNDHLFILAQKKGIGNEKT